MTTDIWRSLALDKGSNWEIVNQICPFVLYSNHTVGNIKIWRII